MQNQTPHETMDTKQKILQATAQIINTTGVLALTLEAVAKQAKISKGGLLYHYPSKDALLRGMNDYLLQSFINEVECTANEDLCENGKWTRAYTAVTFNQLDAELDMNVAFLAAAATNSELRQSIAKHLQILQDRIEHDHIDPTLSAIVRLAVDGMYFNQLYGISLSEDMRKTVLNALISLTKEDAL